MPKHKQRLSSAVSFAKAVSLSFATVALVACGAPAEDGSLDDFFSNDSIDEAGEPVGSGEWFDETSNSQGLVVTSASLSGQIGETGTNGVAQRIRSFTSSTWTSIDATVVNPGSRNGAGMVILDIQGNLNSPSFSDGQILRFNHIDGSFDGGDDGVFVDVVGCSGEAVDEWTFDQPAEETVVEVEEEVAMVETDGGVAQPEVIVTLNFTASFTDYFSGARSTVQGSTSFVRP